jgi:2,3-bisphosphoglycerate-dependent phosphoglycerate mutase
MNAPLLRGEQVVLVVAHGNSLRALMMHLERMDLAAIAALEIPTGAIRAYLLDHTGQVPEARWL